MRRRRSTNSDRTRNMRDYQVAFVFGEKRHVFYTHDKARALRTARDVAANGARVATVRRGDMTGYRKLIADFSAAAAKAVA